MIGVPNGRVSITFFGSLPAPSVNEETRACVRMWRAVIDQSAEDLINEPRNREEEEAQKAAVYWLDRGVFYDASGEGFEDVCDLAYLPTGLVERKIRAFVEVYRGI